MDEEREGTCLIPFLIGMLCGIVGFHVVKFFVGLCKFILTNLF